MMDNMCCTKENTLKARIIILLLKPLIKVKVLIIPRAGWYKYTQGQREENIHWTAARVWPNKMVTKYWTSIDEEDVKEHG